MPFQVTFSTKLVNLMDVRLLSAGDDQTLYCGLIVQLNAIVDQPLNLPGHVVSWEQLDGAPVTLSDASTLHPWYPFTETSDKLFRVWMDRGTPIEQHDDVYVYHTPTSKYTCSFNGDHYFNRFVPTDEVPCSSIVGTVIVTPLPPQGTLNDNDSASIRFELVWNLPQHVDLQPLLTEMVVYENGVPVQSYLPTDTRKYIGGLSVYSILSKFNVRGTFIEDMSCEKDYTGSIVPNTRIINDTLPNESISTAITTIIKYTNDVLRQTSSVVPLSISTESIAIQKYTFERLTHESKNSPASISTEKINITRTDPSGIGGGG